MYQFLRKFAIIKKLKHLQFVLIFEILYLMEIENTDQTELKSQHSFHKNIFNQKGGFLIALGAILIALIVGAGGYFLMNKQNLSRTSNKQGVINSVPTPQPKEGSKFIYFHRVLATPPQNTINYDGRTFKDQFVLYDVTTKTKKVFYEETPNDDNVDSYSLFDNQNIAITSPRGNKVISLDGQSVSTPPDNYFSDTYSPSKNVRVQFQFKDNDVIFSVVNTQTGLRKSIEMKQNLFLVPSIVGWSKDENYVFFTLVQTHFGDPTRSLYQLDIGKGEVTRFPRDISIADVEATYINSQRDEIYFKGKNGLFRQLVNETKANSIQFQDIHLVYGGNLIFPEDVNNQSLALSDDQGLWIKNLNSGKEYLIFQKKNDGTVTPISWKGDNLIFTFRREGYNTEENNKKYGQYIIGYIYNTQTKQLTEFAENKSDSLFTLGRLYFIDWLEDKK